MLIVFFSSFSLYKEHGQSCFGIYGLDVMPVTLSRFILVQIAYFTYLKFEGGLSRVSVGKVCRVRRKTGKRCGVLLSVLFWRAHFVHVDELGRRSA